MIDYAAAGGKSRGSAIYLSCNTNGSEDITDFLSFVNDSGELDSKVEITTYDSEKDKFSSIFRDVRPLPEGGGFFENVWRSYRENKNTY